jgi:diaminohydroxyphosphoribosylaminopyrimidine deaminase/5-amino-6-(5-phosphoribosylamino)uracil reductase
MTADEKFMREAIKLARRGAGQTRPNPAVGCVLVKNGRIIARGYHRRAGQPHAEIEALRTLKNPDRARGATAYVTLEPCSTHGRTPPCTEALARAGLARVVIGAIDPNPRHRGRGLACLARAGIETVSGLLADQCATLNPEFHHFMLTGMPWVVAKCGMSLDGRLTRPPGEGQWITSTAARADAMKLRARVGAILVGAGTIRADDPALTVRGIKSVEQPRRIVWAPRSQPAATAQVLTDHYRQQTIVLRQSSLRAALRALGRQGIQSVLVEGGGHTLGQLFSSHLANEVVFYLGPMIAGGRVPAVAGAELTPPATLICSRVIRLGSCLRLSGLVRTERP